MYGAQFTGNKEDSPRNHTTKKKTKMILSDLKKKSKEVSSECVFFFSNTSLAFVYTHTHNLCMSLLSSMTQEIWGEVHFIRELLTRIDDIGKP